MIKNLSQLKKALIKGAEFEITEHCRKEEIGQRRMVNYADTTGIYSTIPTEPDSKVTQANGGKGSYLQWGKASLWEFREDGTCAYYKAKNGEMPENALVAIRVIEEETA